MTTPAPLSLAERFAQIISGLQAATVAPAPPPPRSLPLPAPILQAFRARVRWVGARLAAFARRLRLGVLLPARLRARRPACPAPAAPPSPPHPGRPPKGWPGSGSMPALPRSFGWMVHYLPETAAYVAALEELMADPEMAALIAAEPRVRRVLRPLCHMMGVAMPPRLAPAKAGKAKRPKRAKRQRAAQPRGSVPEPLEQSVWRELGLAEKPPHPA